MPSPPWSALSHEDAGVHPSELPRAIFHALATEFGDHVRVTDRSNARIVHAMHFAVCDEAGVERHVEPASSLSTEISAVPSDIQTHFLSELPKHATMLVMAIGDACSGLLTLGPSLPFSSTGVARMLLEAAGDLHWLADPGLAASERARRAITVYLRQTETTIRQLEQLRERTSQDDYDAGIAEGWELLRHTADSAALGGYRVNESRRPGQKYILHPGKPSISRLVDEAITRFYGSTGVNLYSLYSSTAHAEGSGLGSLLDTSARVETDHGDRVAYGLPEPLWTKNVLSPCLAVAVGVVREWVQLALPGQLEGFARRLP
jgi:hypothetical protein